MKKLFYVALVLPMAMFVIACGGKQENPEADSLRNVLNSRLAEMSEMDLFLDAVNASMDSVLDLDGTVLRGIGEGNATRKDQIQQNIAAYKDVLERQRERLSELENKLKANNNQNAKLLKTVESLKAQIVQKDEAIAQLTAELEKSNYSINTLKASVEKLSNDVATLQEESNAKDEAIVAQSDMLNEAYVLIGTKKQLKEAGVLSGGSVLKKSKLDMKDVNMSAFTKIDIRKQKSFTIPSKKPSILTQVPAGSYTLTENENEKGSSILTITDPAQFWSMSKFLVVKY
ncbi:MAG: hypothetical protein J6W56_10845 [Prevotella sp.]|nr:hypothetical protein [Prevotella sp.]